jgi:cell shape-determining protein MreC
VELAQQRVKITELEQKSVRLETLERELQNIKAMLAGR